MAEIGLKAIKCGRLIDGNGGEPLENAVVIIDGTLIKAVGKNIPIPEGAKIFDASGKTVMPGLIDSHLHIGGGLSDRMGETMSRPKELALIKAIFDSKNLLAAGFTTAKDCAGPNAVYLKKSVAEGVLTGLPRIISAVYGLTQTFGHADQHFNPIECVDARTSKHSNGSGALICDGVPECIKATRYALRSGADFIKIMSTGGVSSERDKPNDVQFNLDEINAIVETAAQVGKYVTSHSQNSRGSKNAILGGVKTIEHANETNDEVIALGKEKGVIFVSTLAVCRFMVDKGQALGVPSWAVEKAKTQWEYHIDSYNRIRKAGAILATGTDYTGRPSNPHGKNAVELELMVKYTDYTPLEVITAATKYGAMACFMGDKTGTIEAGKFADIIVVDGNPLDDISLLQNIDKIKIVMLEGKVEINRV